MNSLASPSRTTRFHYEQPRLNISYNSSSLAHLIFAADESRGDGVTLAVEGVHHSSDQTAQVENDPQAWGV